MQKTIAERSSKEIHGIIFYQVRSMMGRDILHLLDVSPAPQGTYVDLHSKGDTFRSTEELAGNLPKWLAGQTGQCRGAGDI